MKTTLKLLLVSAALLVLAGCAGVPVTGSSMTAVNSPGPWNGINPKNAMPSQ
jgi:ABC-type glycerol-3-phosphate transport system substrate-binding protein